MSNESPASIIFDSTGTAIGSVDTDGYNRLQVQTELSSGQSLPIIITDGTIPLGTSTHPIRIDPTGTTTQPISVSALPLPLGAATEATLNTLLTQTDFNARVNTLGQKSITDSMPVVIASDQTVIPVSDNGGSLTVDGTIATTQSGTWVVQPGNTANTNPWLATISQGGNSATVKAANTPAVASDPAIVVAISPNNSVTSNADGYASTAAPSYTNNTFQPLSLTTAGALRTDSSATIQPISGTVTANPGAGSFTVAQATASNLNATIIGTTAAGSGASSGLVTIQGNASGTAVPVSGTGNFTMVGAGTAGSPTGGIITVQGDPIGTAIPISGVVTVNQGSPNILSNKWPIQITDGTNTMPTGDAISRAIFNKITDGTNIAGVDTNNHIFVAGKSAVGVAPTSNPISVSGIDGSGFKRIPLTDANGRLYSIITDGTNTAKVQPASTAPVAADPSLSVALSPNTNLFSFGIGQRLNVRNETLLFFDDIDGTTIHTNRWIQTQSGMTQVQSGGNLVLNSGSSNVAGTYSILTSIKQVFTLQYLPVACRVRAAVVPQTNAVLELGIGNVSDVSTPTDGVFFRITDTGTLKCVVNFSGTETITDTLVTLTASKFYNFDITMYDDRATFRVGSIDNSVNINLDIMVPSNRGSLISVGHIPFYVRVYNSSTTSASAQLLLAMCSMHQMDLSMQKSWAEQMAGTGRDSSTDPGTMAQNINYDNSTAPVTATLSNTTAGYSNLGGLFQFNAVAGSETDYALFAYKVPTRFQLYIWTITINTFIIGAQTSLQPTLLQWAFGTNSSGVSLSTGSPYPPIRTVIGMQQINKNSNIGDIFNPGTIIYSPKAPIVINSGRYFHIILRVPVGNATPNQIIRGSCAVEGYYE